jgi:hypothetical protein
MVEFSILYTIYAKERIPIILMLKNQQNYPRTVLLYTTRNYSHVGVGLSLEKYMVTATSKTNITVCV